LKKALRLPRGELAAGQRRASDRRPNDRQRGRGNKEPAGVSKNHGLSFHASRCAKAPPRRRASQRPLKPGDVVHFPTCGPRLEHPIDSNPGFGAMRCWLRWDRDTRVRIAEALAGEVSNRRSYSVRPTPCRDDPDAHRRTLRPTSGMRGARVGGTVGRSRCIGRLLASSHCQPPSAWRSGRRIRPARRDGLERDRVDSTNGR